MAEPHVADLIRRINQLVEQDTGALSMATGEQLPRMVRDAAVGTEALRERPSR